ncbi:LOW QUALITY PROTEIN: melanin-concentrating hormone receptor 1-like [Rhincodon typus]|uniref:LOW QUALITY PROTEIN: melanin-concentrating hormone receptor 1-like n=1 Tax=Rhincodon typus TaxID=259920 RepID=UPI00202E6A83|nr:LOW QUALITY PROTEIN: melanin-concentrating hormone receptor 1-like [Rhincodon typus]
MPTIFILIALSGIIGNTIVIFTVIKNFKFKSSGSRVPDVFFLSLSVVDLLFLMGMPFVIPELLGNRGWYFGSRMCTVISVMDTNTQFSSTYILAAMTIDTYLAIVYPLTSARFRKPCFATLTVCCLCLLSFLSVIPVWMYAGLLRQPGGLSGCVIRFPNPKTDMYWFTIYQFFLAFAIPFTVISVAYRKILLKMSSPSSLLSHERARLRTRKVARIASTICLTFLLCWAPFYLLQLVQLTPAEPTLLFYYAYVAAVGLGYSSSCLNPFIYIILCNNFRKSFIISVRPSSESQQVHRAVAWIGKDAQRGQKDQHHGQRRPSLLFPRSGKAS